MQSNEPSKPVFAKRQPAWLVYAAFFALTTVAASVGGLIQPGEWYASLQKPAWNPPNWLFAPVWTVLYVMIALAGAHVWRATGDRFALMLWVLQLGLNAAWTWLFFGLHRPGLALIEIGCLLLVIVGFIARTWTRCQPAAWLFVPYALWVGYASALNAALWLMNT